MIDTLDIWQTLDFLYEDVEKGLASEEHILKSEAFAVCAKKLKTNENYYDEVPSYLKYSKLFRKHCALINPAFSIYID